MQMRLRCFYGRMDGQWLCVDARTELVDGATVHHDYTVRRIAKLYYGTKEWYVLIHRDKGVTDVYEHLFTDPS